MNVALIGALLEDGLARGARFRRGVDCGAHAIAQGQFDRGDAQLEGEPPQVITSARCFPIVKTRW